ncbi:MAG TPA: hypothetical protein VGS06_33880 [Streptosporangiaceae bacterium]|nr:hypothetical protein [Streptosporangiaceae bacterium]
MTLAAFAAAAASSTASNDVEPGVLGFLVVAAMGVALVFLLRSMNKQFRKITPDPDAPDGEQPNGEQPGGEHADGEQAGAKAPAPD